MAQIVKNLCAMQETQVRVLGWGWSPEVGNGNPLQYSCLENSWIEEPGGLQFTGLQRVRHDRVTFTFTRDSFKYGLSQGSRGPHCNLTQQQLCKPPTLFSILLKYNTIHGKSRTPVSISAFTPNHLNLRQVQSLWSTISETVKFVINYPPKAMAELEWTLILASGPFLFRGPFKAHLPFKALMHR